MKLICKRKAGGFKPPLPVILDGSPFKFRPSADAVTSATLRAGGGHDEDNSHSAPHPGQTGDLDRRCQYTTGRAPQTAKDVWFSTWAGSITESQPASQNLRPKTGIRSASERGAPSRAALTPRSR